MTKGMEDLLRTVERRLGEKGLFGKAGDSVSLRIPGSTRFMICEASDGALRTLELDARSEEAGSIHGFVYRVRPDAGAIVLGSTPWTGAVAAMGARVPTLFDEQARHIGKTHAPVPESDQEALSIALRDGGNAAILGARRLGIGSTPNRVVLNADLFEKCSKAFVIASASGQAIRSLPTWVTEIWNRRLISDQSRAGKAYRSGRIPEGMDAY